ncbi:MAG TPA: DNA starvation/stationary phase protection protein [Flavobacterium sp.]|nr:DNA starvation/stationary phase protection protein [Flavobacterium sp.]
MATPKNPLKGTQKVADFLSILLADESILYLKMRNAHWNVEGSDFHAMHIYFEELYTAQATNIDEVAERIRKIDHFAPATMSEYLKLTHLTEKRGNDNNSMSYIKELNADIEAIIIYIREKLEELKKEIDQGTEDYVNALAEQHETTAWMLRSHLR